MSRPLSEIAAEIRRDNASTWRGEVAKRIKAELRGMVR
jgi:hypothetical protein